MLKISTVVITTLIDSILAKRQWTQTRLAQEMNIGPETISRWKSGTGIHKGHYDELLRLERDEEIVAARQINSPLEIPFSVTIPRDRLKVSVDGNGDINVSGVMLALINKEG